MADPDYRIWTPAGRRLDTWRFPRQGFGFVNRYRSASAGASEGTTQADVDALARSRLAAASYSSYSSGFGSNNYGAIYRVGYNPASPTTKCDVFAIESQYYAAGLYPASGAMRARWEERSIPEHGGAVTATVVNGRGYFAYAAGDVLAASLMLAVGYSTPAVMTVSTVDGSGAITAVSITGSNTIFASLGGGPQFRTPTFDFSIGTLDSSRSWDYSGAPSGSLYTFDSTNVSTPEIDDSSNVYTLSPPATGYGYKFIVNPHFSTFLIYGSPDIEDSY